MIQQIEYLSNKIPQPFVNGWYEFADAKHFWMQWRMLALLSQLKGLNIKLRRSARALDIGSGQGVFRSQLESVTDWTVDCTDLNEHALESAVPSHGRTLFYDVQEEREELLHQYDYVFLFDVIEHIEDPKPLIASAIKHLKDGGVLLINVPASQSLFSEYDRVVGHVRRYDKNSLKNTLKGFKLSIVDMRYWGFSLIPFLWLRRFILSLGWAPKDTVKIGFEPPGKIFHTVFLILMRLEMALFKNPMRGTSLMFAGRVQEV